MSSAQLDTLLGHIRRLADAKGADDKSDAQLLERFIHDKEDAAFAVLVRRHGPLVLGVCRRLLGQAQDAEDAFQATFLVLARKAGAVRRPEALGCWLYEVAYHIALRARTHIARRRAHERQAIRMASSEPNPETTWADILPMLDEELHRLPDRYRQFLVACYLDGKSHAAAARELGCPPGSVSRHLQRARELLRERLAQRGITLSAGVLAAVLTEKAPAAVSFALIIPTVRAALAFVTDQATGAVSARAAALAQGALRTMFLSTGKGLIALLLAVTIVAGHVALLARGPLAAPLAAPTQGPTPGWIAAGGPTHVRTDAGGDALPAEAIARLGTRRFRPSGLTTAVRFRPDGKALFTMGASGLCIWEVPTGRLLHRLANRPHRFLGPGILSPDGKQVVSVELDPKHATLRLWDVASGRLVRELGEHPCVGACFTPDGKTLATFGTQQPLDPHFRDFATIISLWDLKTGLRTGSWVGHQDGTYCGVFTTDGKTLITGGADRTIRFWDPATGKETGHLTTSASAVGHLVLSSDGKRLAAVGLKDRPAGVLLPSGLAWSANSRIDIWDLPTGKEIQRFTVPQPKQRGLSGVTTFIFAPDNKAAITGGPDACARVWDLATGKERRRYDFGGHTLWGLALSTDGKMLAGITGISSVQLIDMVSGKTLGPSAGHRGEVRSAILTPDRKTALTVAGGDSAIHCWDVPSGREKPPLEGTGPFPASLELAHDGRTLYCFAYPNGPISVWNFLTRKVLRRLALPNPKSPPALLRLSPDGRMLALASVNGETWLMDSATGTKVRRLRGPGTDGLAGVFQLAFTPGSRRLVLFCDDRNVQVWDTAHASKVREFLPPGCIRLRGNFLPSGTSAAALSPDGKLLAYVRPSRSWALCELASRMLVYSQAGPSEGVSAFAFSPDSRTLAWSGGRDPTIHLLEVASGQERHRLAGHDGPITSLTFAPAGTALLSGSSDTTALVWDLTGRAATGRSIGEALTPTGLNACWADLASPDAARAYQAIRRLAAAPRQAVPYLAQRLRPVPHADDQRIARLIADLDSRQFAVRQRVLKELNQFGERALESYRKVLEGHPSLEVRNQLERLCAKYSVHAVPLRTVRTLEALELAGTGRAYEVFTRLARGAPGTWLTEQARAALQRRAALVARIGNRSLSETK